MKRFVKVTNMRLNPFKEEIDNKMKGKFRILGNIGLVLFMACALMLVAAPAAKVEAATAVTDVWVEFPAEDAAGQNPGTYNVRGQTALYRIHFTATTALKRGVDKIVVQFPDGLDSTMGTVGTTYAFTLGAACNTETNFDVMVDPYAAAGKSYLDYHECTAAAKGGQRITLTIGVDIAAGQDAWLLIDDTTNMVEGGVENTTAYKVYVNTSQDTTPVLSKGFYLGDSGDQVDPGNSGVTVSPSTAGSVAQYIFLWDNASTGKLDANTDTITVTFPCGTTLPSSISASSVQVFGDEVLSTCGLDPVVDTDLRTVRVTTPCDIATDDNNCYVKFLSTAGITNPTYGNTGWGFTTRLEHVGFIRTTEAAQDVVCDDNGYTIDESSATTLDFDYTATPRLVVGLSDKYSMINMYSSVLYLQVEDQYGNLCNTGSYISAQVTLSSSSGTGTFSIDSGSSTYTQITGTQTLDTGAKEIYYRDSTAGTHTLTASYSGLDTATWTFQVCPGASLYDRYDNLIHTYAPTTSAPAQETDVSGGSYDWDVYKGGKYVDLATDAATAYDVIVLGDGHYEVDNVTNHLSFSNTYLTIKSLNGADYTTLDGSAKTSSGDHAADPTIYMGGSNITIDGLTISNNPTGTEGNRGIYFQGTNAFTIQNCKFVDCPCDNIILEATSAVTSGTITNNTFTGVGPRGHDGRYAIWLQSTSGNNVSGVSVTNNTFTNFTGLRGTAIGLVEITGTMSNMTIQGNTISNCWRGIRLYGNTAGPTGLTDDYAIAENTITDCTIGVSVGGDVMEMVFNFKNNTISGFTQYGIDIASTTLNTGTAISIQYNDITGTGDWGIYNHAGTVTVEPECKYNWWGDATGPSAGSGSYASTTARGSGEAISKDIAVFSPWLHKPLTDVVADNASYQAVNMKLIVGWNTLSTPVQLIAAADSIDELIPSGMTIGYYYDGGWQQITTGYTLSPCDAVYVKMDAVTYVLLKFDAGAFTTPSKDLATGWNLASLAHLGYTSTASTQMNADDGVASVAKTAANLPGYAQVVSPSLNAGQTDIYGITGTSWAVAYGQDSVDDKMFAGLGYWIYMQNAATLAGFEITPIAPDLN